MPEPALIGWKAISGMFGRSERSMRDKRDELLASGAIFYQYLGRPPRKRICAFPSVLKAWTIRKSAKGEIV